MRRKLSGLSVASARASSVLTTSYGTAATAAADSGVGRNARNGWSVAMKPGLCHAVQAGPVAQRGNARTTITVRLKPDTIDICARVARDICVRVAGFSRTVVEPTASEIGAREHAAEPAQAQAIQHAVATDRAR